MSNSPRKPRKIKNSESLISHKASVEGMDIARKWKGEWKSKEMQKQAYDSIKKLGWDWGSQPFDKTKDYVGYYFDNLKHKAIHRKSSGGSMGVGGEITDERIDEILKHYMIASLWSSHDNSDESGGEPFDANYGIEDISKDSKAKMRADVKKFVEDNLALINESGQSDEMIGHDFWLTRNGHGAGFWDRGLGKVGDKLTTASKKFGTSDLYLGDDKKVYVMGYGGKTTNTKKMKNGGSGKYTDKFEEVYDDSSTKYYIRKFGKVSTDNTENIPLLVIAEVRDLTDAVSEKELKQMTGGQPIALDFTLLPEEKFIDKKLKDSANDENSSISDSTLINIVSYMGGLNFSPITRQESVFDTFEQAKKFLLSKELNDKISALGGLSGFTMDKAYNRMGQTNWDRLSYIIGETETFKEGGSTELSKKVKESKKISEKEINLIKNRINSGKADEETKALVQWIWDNTPELTEEQNKKALDFLMNLWKTPAGVERKNNPFGFREQEALETFKTFELAGFHDISRYGGRPFNVPLYNAIGKDTSFQYYYDGKVNIVGAEGGKMKNGGREKDKHTTKVIFLYNEKEEDLFAYFPEEKESGNTKMSYSHIGQHSSASPEYAKESRLATPEEYKDLKTELENIGYNLKIVNKKTSLHEGGAISPSVATLMNFASTNDVLANEEAGIQTMASDMKWSPERTHQQYKRIFSYMTETAYNKENPETPIEMTEEERNEFATAYSNSEKPEDKIEEAKHHLMEANNALDEAQAKEELQMKTGGGAGRYKEIKKRLEYLRKEIRAERISYGELAELQSLAKYIDPSDVELLEASGVPEKRSSGGSMAGGGGVEEKYAISVWLFKKGSTSNDDAGYAFIVVDAKNEEDALDKFRKIVDKKGKGSKKTFQDQNYFFADPSMKKWEGWDTEYTFEGVEDEEPFLMEKTVKKGGVYSRGGLTMASGGGAGKKSLKKGDTVQIVGRRWFEKVNGNTYHSVDVYVNNELIGRKDYAYGYGDQYEQSGMAILREKYRFPPQFEKEKYISHYDLKEYGINILSTVSDVSRKKDLEIGGEVKSTGGTAYQEGSKPLSNSTKGKQNLKDKISKMEKALAGGKLSEKGKASMEKKLEKYKRDVSRRTPVFERMVQGKGKFFIEIPSEYRLKMNSLLHGTNLKPRYVALDDKLRITVDNKPKLNRLYKIYSDMLTKKSIAVPTLAEISGKPSKVRAQK